MPISSEPKIKVESRKRDRKTIATIIAGLGFAVFLIVVAVAFWHLAGDEISRMDRLGTFSWGFALG